MLMLCFVIGLIFLNCLATSLLLRVYNFAYYFSSLFAFNSTFIKFTLIVNIQNGFKTVLDKCLKQV
jgi:hypothetical protein